MRFLYCLALMLLITFSARAQDSDADILKVIVEHFYKNEKPVYKNRSQLTYFYCEKPNNNEEIFETVRKIKLSPKETQSIRKQVNAATQTGSWQQELETIFVDDKSQLSTKINSCLTLEQYNETRNPKLNNQKLMIVSKPIFYQNQTHALVKVVFYRNIEHNNGSVVHLEKIANKWVVKEFLSEWAT